MLRKMQIGAGKFKNRKLLEPKGLETRPTSHKLRLAIFNKIQHRIEGASFLDLFAGVGAMGLEAISRGAAKATFVEKNVQPFQLIKKNAESLGCAQVCRFIKGDAVKFCEKEVGIYDIIYADPPYEIRRGGRYQSEILIETIAASGILKKGGDLFLEEGVDAIPNNWFELLSLKKYGGSYLYHFTL